MAASNPGPNQCLICVYVLAVSAGVSPAPPSLLGRGVGLVGGLFAAPRAALRAVNKRVGNVQRLWWRLEDFVVDGGKFAVKFAIKAARPVLVGKENAAMAASPHACMHTCTQPQRRCKLQVPAPCTIQTPADGSTQPVIMIMPH